MKYQNTRRAVDVLLPLGLLVVAAKRLDALDSDGANATMVNAFNGCNDDIRQNVANRMYRLTGEYWPDPFSTNDTPAYAMGVLFWYETITRIGGLGYDHSGPEEALATTIFSRTAAGVTGTAWLSLQHAGRVKGLDLVRLCQRNMLYREYDLYRCLTNMKETLDGTRQ